MKKRILAFGASNSKSSINRRLAQYVVQQIEGVETELLDLNDFEMPIYSIDREKDSGIPEKASKFKQHIMDADAIVISFAEHNGSYTAAYKNIYDWVSRIEKEVWYNKPMFLLSTSPGGRGGKGVLQVASRTIRHANEMVVAEFSLPGFHQNFKSEVGITNTELNTQFQEQLQPFRSALQDVSNTLIRP